MRTLALSLTALALIAGPALAGQYNKVVSVGEKAPTFSGIPAIQGEKETTINLGDIQEDVVVLVFLGNHCPVVQAYEDRHRLRQRLQGQERQGHRCQCQ